MTHHGPQRSSRFATALALSLLAAGCGGGGTGDGAPRREAAAVVVQGPMQIERGARIEWTVHMPDQPADDAPTGYAISLPEQPSRLNIDTAACPAPATAGCERWTITAADDAVPGTHGFVVRPIGLRAEVLADTSVRLSVVGSSAWLGRAVQVAASTRTVLVVARTEEGADEPLRLFGRGGNNYGELASGYLMRQSLQSETTEVSPSQVDSFIRLRGTSELEGWSQVLLNGASVFARRGAQVHAWGRNDTQQLVFASDPALQGAQLQPREMEAFGAVHSVGEGDVPAAVVGANRKVLAWARTIDGAMVSQRVPGPAALGDPLRGVAKVATGNGRIVMRTEDGAVWHARAPQHGTAQSLSTAVAGLPPIDALTMQDDLVLARDAAGRLWWWRESVTPGTPAPVPGIDGVVSMSLGVPTEIASPQRGWAVRSDGSVWSWAVGGTPARVSTLSHARFVGGDGWVITGDCREGDGGLWKLSPGASPEAQREPRFGRDCVATRQPTLLLQIEGQGTVTSEPAGLSCSGPNGGCGRAFDAGSLVQLAGFGIEGRPVQMWSGDCIADAVDRNRARVTMPVAAGVNAVCGVVFAADVPPLLTVLISGPGAVRVDNAEPCYGRAIDVCSTSRSPVTLEALPAAGARFNGWSGACSGGATRLEHAFSGRQSCTASFVVAPTATLTVAVQGSGTVTSSPGGIRCGSDCSATLALPASVTLTATPAAGQRFAGWSGGCSGSELSLTVLVTAPRACTARFEPAPTAEPPLPEGNLVVNPGFEENAGAGGLPVTAGAWSGDATASVAADQGIAPRSGQRMQRFIATGPVAATSTVSSQLWQIVDLNRWREAIAAGGVRAEVGAWFNRVSGGARTDRRFDVRVLAFDGELGALPSRYVAGTALAAAAASIDSSGAAWQPASASLLLPPATRYVLVEVYAFEDVSNDAVLPEFDGHYVDDVSLVLRRP